MIEIIEAETGAQKTLGYVLEIGHEDGSARCRLDVTEAHSNRHGVLHGGIATTILDNAMGATSSLTVDPKGRTPFLTISMSTQFQAPAHAGKRVTATARVTGGGRALLYLEATLVDEDDRLIATSIGVFKRARTSRTEEGR
ncbi:PaaI family thioesterase [Roseibium sp. Sym1]|uniref:PaaI family thioesterase n=1 Tax=Roseibium sp. Sym1 TaxID=3016006 RepID=UPI0022B5DD4E|nr:PaaI family thioesterase [Roseibium sp. Sym1]